MLRGRWDYAFHRDARQGRVGWRRGDAMTAVVGEAVVGYVEVGVSLRVVCGEEGHGMGSVRVRMRGPALQMGMHEAGHEQLGAYLGPNDGLKREYSSCPLPAGTQRARAL
jgi:hypothetical protein